MPPPSKPGLPPRFAGRYDVVREIGSGGMGAVYEVFDTLVGEPVALKVLHAHACSNAAAVTSFREEVRLARRVTSPHVARTFDLGQVDAGLYLTMELVRGVDLRTCLKTGVERAAALEWTRQLCRGLRCAHAAGVVHCDIKPANLLIDPHGRLVITDFGIARALRARGEGVKALGGTPAYMAPEQFDGHAGPAVDVYAVGSVLFEMLSGAPLRRQIQDLLLPPEVVAERLRAAGVDGALSNVVMSMLRREPSERPASVREVAAQLRRSSASQRNAPVRGAPPASLPSMRMPLPNDDPGLVILPLQADPATAELATSLSEELADILSRTRGLRVLAASVGAKMVGRDPRAVGMELGVQYVVEGRFRMLQNHVRVSIRVIDARDGSQRYTERFEAMLQNVFEMQDRMARQIADALRVELAAHRDEGSVPVEAVHAYFDGRRRTRMAVDPSNSGYDQLRMALELAPRFEAAHAALALAAVRAWFAAGTDSEVWHTRARLAVRRALDLAPALPESHLAAGMFASQLGDYTQAAHSLARALVLAPTCAEAQAYLGQLECEAGSAEQGAQRIDFARSLDPQLVIGLDYVARHRALTGDHEGAAHMLERYAQIAGKHHPMVMASRVRFAMWRGEARPARSLLVQLVDTTSSAMQGLRLYLGVVSGELHPEVFVAAMVDFQRTITNPRFVTLGFQLGAEALAWRGALPLAMQQLEAATRAALVDVAWLEGCPALAPLHTQPGWDHTVAYVRARAAAVWSRGVTTR